MFDRLLLAIDDSPESEVATAFATATARRSGASVHVFYVNQYKLGVRGPALRTMVEAAELVTRTMDELAAARVRSDGSTRIASSRQVPACIVEAARTHGADVIIMGSQRRGSRWTRLGSANVRERTTRLTTLPVITAPSPLGIRGELQLVDFDSALAAPVLSDAPQ
jgi:nucleotide-binding universal stress UspA family protein